MREIMHIEELPEKIPDRMLGKQIQTYSGLARIAKMKNGVNRPRIFFKCRKKNCRRGDYFFLLDATFGRGGYAARNFDTQRYDMRDQYYEHCDKHRKHSLPHQSEGKE